MPTISIIIPSYNESPNLAPLYARLVAMASTVPHYDFDFLFVDDGSLDDTPHLLTSLRSVDPRVKVIRLSRNFGSHAACLAGLVHSQADYAVFVAADLQDPPELVPQMAARLEEGWDVVFAIRSQREDPWLTVKLANLYHRLMRRYAIPAWPEGGADVVMIRRSVRDVIIRWRQKNTSLFAQVLWSGFRQCFIPYAKSRRLSGHSKWSWKKKTKLFVDSFVSFTSAPIRFISCLGILSATLGFGYATFVILNKIWFSEPIPSWSSLMVVLLLVSGFQLVALGVVGEYVWRVADEARGSPAFIVEARVGVGSPGEDSLESLGQKASETTWRKNISELKSR